VLGATDDPWIEERRKALEQALVRVRSRLGSLIVQSNVVGADLWIDGARVTGLPSADPIRVVAGTHQLTVTAPGYGSAHRSIELKPNGRAQERFVLTPTPIQILGAVVSADHGNLSGPGPQPRLSRGTWTAVAILGGLLTAGTVAIAVREINAARYNDGSHCIVGGLSREERCGAYRDAANAAEIVAIGAYSAAGLAAIGLGLALTHDFMKGRREVASLHCVGAGLGVQCEGRF
jgi:hypothetical protein